METPQRRTNENATFYGIFGQGGSTLPRSRLILLCLGLLNAVLLIAAVVIGINCAKVKEGSLHVSHSDATTHINQLNYLNHSKLTESEEEANKALDSALKNHTLMKMQIEHQKAINDAYQRQIETLRTEETSLQSNISFFEGGCGKCLTHWIFYNSSCYFFSYLESHKVKKNWPDSRADCVSRGADLVVIDNQEEQKFVSHTIENMKTSPNFWENGFWVGLTDSKAEGTWVWINNVTEVEQRYWRDGEPNNSGHKGEDCGAVLPSSSNPWKTRNDSPCEFKIHWTCEMPSK
ncbi:CD209 antigen-like protein E [Mastacembelus armatus]|uniref:CD209 antigen-like protein E n=1 Tax=Mastacembelus armatus TaxID=205130 RepID=UPI000E456B21|nr:CD209 antigen-like protein E [Mastacembelus armatus]